jgi:DNA-binding CsgD family transcriptional regulator
MQRARRRPRRDAMMRQHQIRLLYALGITPREIAARLDVSRWTVANHLREVRNLEHAASVGAR